MKRAIGKIVVLAAVLFVVGSFVQKLTDASMSILSGCLRLAWMRRRMMTVAEYHRLRNHLEDKVINVRRPAAEFAEKVLSSH